MVVRMAIPELLDREMKLRRPAGSPISRPACRSCSPPTAKPSTSPRSNAATAATGARRSELAACEVGDLDLETGTLRLGRTKTGEPRRVAIGAQAKLALHRYILQERGRQDGALFLGRAGVALSADGMKVLIRRLGASAGVMVGTHDFRRGLASSMLAAGVPLDVVMGQLGHRTPTMSLHYGRQGREERNIVAYREFDELRRRHA